MPFKDKQKKREANERWRRSTSGVVYYERKHARAKERAAAIAEAKRLAPRMPRKRDRRGYNSQKAAEVRLLAIAMLGGQCVRCGIADERVLQFDHIKPLLRRTNNVRSKKSNYTMWRHIASGDTSHGMQLLCANCHCIKTREGNEWALRFNVVTINDGSLINIQRELF